MKERKKKQKSKRGIKRYGKKIKRKCEIKKKEK